MFSILIIEDEQRVANLIQTGLTELGYNCLVAYDGIMGMRIFNANNVDLIISDVVVPGMNGFDVCKQIRTTNASIPIIMLTALGSTDDKLEGFDAGADDYLVKPFDFRELHARVKSLLKRGVKTVVESQTYLSYSNLTIDTTAKIVRRDEVEIALSPKEYKLLVYMLENADRVVSRLDIAEKVWNTKFDTGTNFIDVYINYLRKKVDKEFSPKLIHTKIGMGFILTDKM